MASSPLAARRDGRWVERSFPIDGDGIEDFFTNHSYRLWDLYFCPNAFNRNRRLGMYALPTCYAHCDIDGGDPATFEPAPTILVETSPRRTQGIWEFGTAVSSTQAEAVSRALTRTYGGDRGGWSITKFLRIPGSFNHKPQYDLPVVTIVMDTVTPIEHWPSALTTTGPRQSVGPGRAAEVDPLACDWRQVISKYEAKLKRVHRRIMCATTLESPNRSRMIFMIIANLYDAGATRDEIAAVVWRSPYFIDKHGANIDRLESELRRICNDLDAKRRK
jgi:RepB DNA-primase from phage plasmid